MKNLFRLLAFTCVILFAASQVNAGGYDKRIEKSFKVKKGGTLYLDSDRGSVEVRSHSAEEVEVVVLFTARTNSRERAEDWFDEFEVSFDHRSADLEVRGEWLNRRFGRRSKLQIHYVVRVPAEYNLDVETSGGSIEVDDLIGEIKLNTSGGSISMGAIDGPVKAETSGGSITLDRSSGRAFVHTSGGSISLGKIDGPVDAKTSGGSITIDGVDGDLEAHTSGGSLRLRNINGDLGASTSGGSIRAELLKQIESDMTLKTSGGSITLDVPANFKAELDASTSGGRVIVDMPMTIRGTIKKSSVRGKINGGGYWVRLRTSGGNIEIRER